MLYRVENLEPVVVNTTYTDATGVTHDVQALTQVWSDEELAEIGLFRKIPAEVPEGMAVKSVVIAFEDGRVVEKAQLVPFDALVDPVSQARLLLADTDWYVIRMMETGTPIPDNILEARSAARATITNRA